MTSNLEIYGIGLMSAQQYFQLYHGVNFIGGGNWNTQKKTHPNSRADKLTF
jgi:hypothetical protein